MGFVLGLNSYHGDASACLVCDGRLVAAAEEERFRRIKHWAGFPSEAIRYCLSEAGITLTDVDHIAINSDPGANVGRKVGFALRNRPSIGAVFERLRNKRKRHAIERDLEEAFPGLAFRGTVHRIEHHLCHLASCFLVSPFKGAVTVSVDGFGDFSSAAWGCGKGQDIQIDGRVFFPHSLGIFYQALTQYLGFWHYGDEYKVMGLAPYGKPAYLDAMRDIVRFSDDGSFALDTSYFRHHKEKISYTWSGGIPEIGQLYSDRLVELLGPARNADTPLDDRHRDIAHSAQAMYEEAFFHLLNKLHKRYGIDDLTLAGGCAMNSVANGKVKNRTPFRRVYIQSAAGDAGGAIGAAMIVAGRVGMNMENLVPSVLAGDRVAGRFVMDHAFWGPSFDNDVVEALLDERASEISESGCTIERIDDELELCRFTAASIAEGQVVGWFQGRLEWGPRALGNRSILCDPRRADMKDILNFKIKRRESFRPFAPSVLRDRVDAWFEDDDDVPFMMKVLQIREDKRARIPAVTHVNGSGRLQTVYRTTNPRYYRLIEAFEAETGVPMVLNTSFNENEPVVCRPVEALECFLRTRMDLLVMEDWTVRRGEPASNS